MENMNNQFGGIAPKPENYLVFAILTTVCCCLPFGIVAIVKAGKVNEYYAMQQYEMAQMASQETKKWCIIAAATGAVIGTLYLLVYGAALIAAVNHGV